jgi:NADH-quinone oxidoreductase subunit M
MAALGMILAPVYALIIMQKGFFGTAASTQTAGTSNVLDLNTSELLMLGVLVVGLVLLGFWPNLIFTITVAPVEYLMHLGKGG